LHAGWPAAAAAAAARARGGAGAAAAAPSERGGAARRGRLFAMSVRQRAAAPSAITSASADCDAPRPTLLGFDRNSVLAAVGAVCITATILGFQYAIYYTIWLVPASAAADGDELPLASGTY
jgi:hypothetical protein